MLSTRIIPCMDIRGGRIVKGVKFAGLRDAGDPVDASIAYEQQGADELVLLDVDATPEGRDNAVDVVKRVRRALSIPLTVGGGVRSVENAKRLLDAGADKVGVNSAAVERPELIRELADVFGTQCVVIAIDAALRDTSNIAMGWEVVVRSGRDRTGIDVPKWAGVAEDLGAGEVLLTSWDRDGTGTGYDVDLVSAVRREVSLPIIASGGGRLVEHMADAIERGADAVLAASIFHDRVVTVGEVKSGLAERGLRVRQTQASAGKVTT